MSDDATRAWYEQSYAKDGLRAQRGYPNEELVKFLLGTYASMPLEERRRTRVLELGSGVCGNLWMVAREGFDAHGIDLAEGAIDLGRITLDRWGVDAQLLVASMDALPYSKERFDLVIDVFSAYCLPEERFDRCMGEVARVLRDGGRFFSLSPAKSSDAFQQRGPAELLDPSTLDGIRRETSPYFGNAYPFRFISPDEFSDLVDKHGLEQNSIELTSRTYGNRSERFDFVVLSAEKPHRQEHSSESARD